MQKQFIPYNLAVKLKELGFDEPCFKYYFKLERHYFEDFRSASTIVFNEDEPIKLLDIYNHGEHAIFLCKAPLWQQAFDWFREKYNIDSTILPTSNTKYIYRLYEQQSKSKTQIYGEYMGKEYKTYEEAREACLEKLIELVKLIIN